MKQISILVGVGILILLSISFINAENEGVDITIENDTITLQGYTYTTFAGKVPAGFITFKNVSLGDDLIKCEDLTYTSNNVTRTVKTNCTLNINFHQEFPFNFNNTASFVITDQQLQQRYEKCLEDKNAFENGLKTCTKDKNEQGLFESNYSVCSSALTICESTKTTALADKAELEKDQEDNQNRHWIWGIGGLIFGIIGSLWYTGKIGGPRTKNPEESFNAQQAA